MLLPPPFTVGRASPGGAPYFPIRVIVLAKLPLFSSLNVNRSVTTVFPLAYAICSFCSGVSAMRFGEEQSARKPACRLFPERLWHCLLSERVGDRLLQRQRSARRPRCRERLLTQGGVGACDGTLVLGAICR